MLVSIVKVCSKCTQFTLKDLGVVVPLNKATMLSFDFTVIDFVYIR